MAEIINNIAASAGIPAGLGKTVLVSGVTGFVGTAVALSYIQHGFFVHATARSQEKAQAWKDLHSIAQARVKFFIVKDVAEEGAFDEALQGVDVVAHTASPFHMNAQDAEKDMLQPAIQGTMSVLKSAAKVPSVKRVVITSSFAAVMDVDKGAAVGKTYSHQDWNPATYERAKDSLDNQSYLYCASKVLAEKAAWDFVEKEKPGFALSTICPPMVLGAPQQVIESMDSVNTSSASIWTLISGDAKEVPETAFPVGTDVRDIAKAHVLASTLEVAKGQRYLCIAFHFTNDRVADVLRKQYSNDPEKLNRIPQPKTLDIFEHFSTDSSKAEKELGLTWTSFETSVKDTASKLFEIEAGLKQKK